MHPEPAGLCGQRFAGPKKLIPASLGTVVQRQGP